MSYYELYLDESGQFKEISKNGKPSIVAGYLIEKKCSESWAENVFSKTKTKNRKFDDIDIESFHAMEDRSAAISEFNVCLLENLQDIGATIVVFKNRRGNNIVNSDITYLNVFAEGIVCLMRHLLSKNIDDINLKITYATRIQVVKKEESGIIQRIEDDEYIDRIRERIILRLAQFAPNERKRISYTIGYGSARKSSLLMLADAVNYSFRGGYNSLNNSQRERIGKLNALHLDVMEHSAWDLIQAYLSSNRWAEAVYSWYGEYFEEVQVQHNKEFCVQIVAKLKQIGSSGAKVQFEILSNLIKGLIDTRNYKIANSLMERLSEKLFPMLNDEQLLPSEVEFDVHFFRLTTATHEGDLIEADKQIKICRGSLKSLPATWETMDYYLSYKLREAENQKNMYDFRGAIENLTKLEHILRDAVSVVGMIDELGEFGDRIRSTTLGKVLGSRVTARCYLSYEDKFQLELAREDSDAAIEQFERDIDKERQYLVRTMVECYDEKFEEALQWLGRAFKVSDVTPQKILDVFRVDKRKYLFGITYYTFLMAEAMKKRNDIGKMMFDSWCNIPVEDLVLKNHDYPTNLILWRIATCKAVSKSRTAKGIYKEAINATNDDIRNLPHYLTRLAIKAELLGVLSIKKNSKAFTSFILEWNKLKETYPNILVGLYDKIDNLIIKGEIDDKQLNAAFFDVVKCIPIL